MKRCPTCQSTYTDDSLRFCLQDGTTLTGVGGAGGGPTLPVGEKTMRIDSRESGRDEDPPPTEILSSSDLPTLYPPMRTLVTTPQPFRPTEQGAHDFAAPPKQKNNALVIPITIVATVLVLAAGGLGAWFLFGSKQNGASSNGRVDSERTSVTPTSGSPATTPAAPSPTRAPSPVNLAALQKEVVEALNGWAQSSMERDINKHMSYYADTLDIYYTRTNVSASVVRADRQRAYDTYSTLNIELSNILITPDPAGQLANAVLDKTWNFESDEKSTSGSVQQEVRLAKMDGRWRIIGEKDLQVYYINR